MKRIPLENTAIAAAGLVLALLAWPATADFTESEDSPFPIGPSIYDHDLSNPVPIPWDDADFATSFPSGAKLVRGTLDEEDLDAYSFSLVTGQLVLAALFEDDAGERNDAEADIFTGMAGPALATDDDAGHGYFPRFQYSVTSPGVYEIGVRRFGAALDGSEPPEATGALFPYWLAVAAVSDPPPLAESEGNDVLASANPLPPTGGVLRGTLSAQDVDFFQIDLQTGDRLAISVFDLENGSFVSAGGERNDAILRVFDPAGAPAAGGDDDDGGPGRMPNLLFTATQDGTWSFAVSGFGDDGFTGNHEEEPFDYLLVVLRERACPNVVPMISNIVASTANSYVVAELQGGDHYYTDRNNSSRHVLVDVPDDYECAEWIKTANNDKGVTDPNHLSFTLAQDASVFVGYDSRASFEPAWLAAGFTPTGEVLDIRDSDVNQEFLLLRRDFAAGTVVLGGNSSPSGGSNYSVLALPLPLGDLEEAFEVPGAASAVTVTVSGVEITVARGPGQTPADVAAALADAVNADPTLAAARIFGLASGASFVTTGVIESTLVTVFLPGLAPMGLPLLAAVLLASGLWRCHRRDGAQEWGDRREDVASARPS